MIHRASYVTILIWQRDAITKAVSSIIREEQNTAQNLTTRMQRKGLENPSTAHYLQSLPLFDGYGHLRSLGRPPESSPLGVYYSATP